jgi:hypothetical protein
MELILYENKTLRGVLDVGEGSKRMGKVYNEEADQILLG